MANEGGNSDNDRARWRSFLADYLFEHEGTVEPTSEDRDGWRVPLTQRRRFPADADHITPWLDAHVAQLRRLADALLPSPVDRLLCCRDVNERSERWRDPLDWPAWRDAELPEWEQHRADLRAIVDKLDELLVKGRAVPPFDTPATKTVAEPAAAQLGAEHKSDSGNVDLRGKVDRAIAALLHDVRNGGRPRSDRAYCRDVGIEHPSTLTRNASWRAAKAGAAKVTARTTEVQGSRDAEGNVEAWLPVEPCENCGAGAPLVQRLHRGAAVRVCEACAGKLGS